MSSSSDPFRHRPGKSSREIGDAPQIGYVPRMHKGLESRAGRRSRRIRGSEVKVNVSLFVTTGLIIIGLVVVGLVVWVSGKQKKMVEHAPLAPQTASGETAVSEIPPSPAPDPEELEKMVRKFLAVRSPEALAPLIRPTEQDPAVIVGKLAKLDEVEGKVSSVSPIGSIDSQSLQIEAAVVYFSGTRNRLAFFSPDEKGDWRLDFDAFDRHVSPDWDTLLSGKPVEGTVRVFLSPDSYYNGIYRDDSHWACFGMASPDSDVLMFGYVPRDSRQNTALTNILAAAANGTNRSKSVRVTLGIKHSSETDHRQFEIVRVLSDDWSVGSQPLEDKIGDVSAFSGK